MLDRPIGIAGLAVTLTAFIVPYLLPRLPSWTKLSGLSVGFFLFGLIVADRRSDETPLDILTNLNLEFFRDQRTPPELYQHNIGTWYALWSPSATIAQVDNNGREIRR
jgi:hypothetical protein